MANTEELIQELVRNGYLKTPRIVRNWNFSIYIVLYLQRYDRDIVDICEIDKNFESAHDKNTEEFPKEPNPEEIEADIIELLEKLNGYWELYDQLSPDLQERWYWTEQEGRIAKDRQTAKDHLEGFIKFLEEERSKRG